MVFVSKININGNLPQFFCEADIVFVNLDHKNHGIIHFVDSIKKFKFKNIYRHCLSAIALFEKPIPDS